MALEVVSESPDTCDRQMMEADSIIDGIIRFSCVVERRGVNYGLSRSAAVLSRLLRHEQVLEEHPELGAFSQAELARTFGVTSQSMGEMLVKMEREGDIARKPSPHDSRSLEVHLTDKGRAHGRQIIKQQSLLADHVLSGLSQRERLQLGALVNKLNESLVPSSVWRRLAAE